jgi:hypothetical protein
MTGDVVNAAFEMVGSAFTWMNVLRVRRDRGYAGIYLPAILFFFSWGFWNLFYYPSLGQWWSFGAGLSLVCANLAWVVAMVYYGPVGRTQASNSLTVLCRRMMRL